MYFRAFLAETRKALRPNLSHYRGEAFSRYYVKLWRFHCFIGIGITPHSCSPSNISQWFSLTVQLCVGCCRCLVGAEEEPLHISASVSLYCRRLNSSCLGSPRTLTLSQRPPGPAGLCLLCSPTREFSPPGKSAAHSQSISLIFLVSTCNAFTSIV